MISVGCGRASGGEDKAGHDLNSHRKGNILPTPPKNQREEIMHRLDANPDFGRLLSVRDKNNTSTFITPKVFYPLSLHCLRMNPELSVGVNAPAPMHPSPPARAGIPQQAHTRATPSANERP